MLTKRLVPLLTAAAFLSGTTEVVARAECTTCLNPSFGSAIRAYRTATISGVAFTDLNRDGFPDLVAVPGEPGPLDEPTVSVLPATGTGSLGPVSTFTIPALARSVAAADFDGDGLADVALLSSSGEEIFFLAGTGDGALSPATTSASPSVLGGPLVAGDFNSDGIPDLAATSGHLVVLIGNGDGTFQNPRGAPGTDGTFRFVVADFNGDGHLDIAGDSTGIAVSLGTGDGTFQLPVTTSPAIFGLAAVGDFNRDGKPDLACANSGGDAVIYLGQGNGSFNRGATYLVDIFSPTSIVADDLNADGLTDVAVGAQYGTLALFLGNGDGTFHGGPYQTLFGPDPMASADLDRDGFHELLVASGPLFAIHRSRSTGFLFPSVHLGTDVPVAVAAADFSGDSIPDIAAAVVSGFGTRAVQILVGSGSGTFTIQPGAPLGEIPVSMTSVDFTGDGKTDLIVATAAGFTALKSKGDTTFDSTMTAGPAPDDLVVGDFNDDGHLDVVTSSNGLNEIDVYLGDGAGNFAPSSPYTSINGSLAVGDFNEDDHLDLAVLQLDHLQVLMGNGSGSFSPGATIDDLDLALVVVAADFTNHGRPDLLVETQGVFTVYPSNGDGTFGAGIPSPAVTCTPLRPADLNGDGKVDLAGEIGNAVSLFLGAGDGTFHQSSSYFHSGQAFGVSDLNGDGRQDLILPGYYSLGSRFGTISPLLSTQCDAQRLVVIEGPATCDAPEIAFAVQPVVKVFDDGDNVIACDAGTVTASIAHGTGTAGAVLSGTTSVSAVAGVATFTDLSIDQPGAGYRLQFSHPVAGITHGRTLSQGLTVLLNGPTLSCDSFPPTYRTGSGGYDRYLWKLDDAAVSRAAMPTLAGLSEGDHTLEVTVFQDGCTATDSRTINVSSAPPPPFIGAPLFAAPGATGLQASVQPHAGSAYLWTLSGGTMTAGQGTAQITFNAGAPGTTMVLQAFEISPAGCESPGDIAFLQVDFADAGSSNPFHDAISAIARNGISKGCGGGNFCPEDILTRAQMAIFLLRAEHGGTYQPPALGGFGTGFADVGPDDFAATFIKQLGVEKITLGCGSGNYCPDNPVTRAQMAIFLLRTEHGADYLPPDATGALFTDVQPGDFGARFIEQLAHEGISGGCGNNNFCPNDPVSRAQMAAFLRRTSNLP